MSELALIKNKNDRKLFETVKEFLEHLSTGMSPIQVRYFVLNEIEFPTPYSKFLQAKLELAHRYARVVEIYYAIRKTKAKIDVKAEAISIEKSKAKRNLLQIEKEELKMKALSLEAQLKTITEEAKIFFVIYKDHEGFDKLPQEEKAQLEMEAWSAKARNMPHLFEERYGDDFVRIALGQGYRHYLETRRKSLGLLPRELLMKSIENK